MKKLFLCLCAFIAAGCAAKLDMNIVSPAADTNAAAYKSVAVWRVSGDTPDRDYTRKFEDALSSLKFDGKPVFAVNKSAALLDLRGGASLSADDPKSISDAAKKLGVQALWIGVLSEEYSESSYKRTKNSCDEIKPGGPGDNCGSYLTVCSRKIITVTANLGLFGGDTGEAVYSAIISGEAEADMCTDDGAWISEKELRDQAVDKIAAELVRQVAPHEETVKVEIMTDTDGIGDAASLNLFKNGIGFAKEKRMDKACLAWNKAFERSPHAVSLMYNVSLCRELAGDYEGALGLLTELDQILPPAGFINKLNKLFKVQDLPNNLVTSAIARNKKHIADRELLNEQMSR